MKNQPSPSTVTPLTAQKASHRNPPKRPLLRYFGGKWQLRHWIISHFPSLQFYAEPFAGAASVLLAKEPASGGEMLNDLNGDLINLFRVMKDESQAQKLREKLKWTPYAHSEWMEARKDSTTNPVTRAQNLLVRSFMSIQVAGTTSSGSGFRMGNVDLRRVDRSGKKTFRNCARDWENWKTELEAIHQRLSQVMIYQRDALDFISLMDSPNCLLYIDPPYHHRTRSQTRYTVEFTEHEKLVSRLLDCSAKIIISGYDCQASRPLEEAGWERIEKPYRANMSKRRRTEILWRSPNCSAS